MNNKTIKQILDSYSFPKLFYVKYAVAVAKYDISFIDKPTTETLRALDLAERYSLGEHIKPEALKEAASAAYAAYNDAVYAIAESKDPAKAEADLHDLLLSLMGKEFNEFELLMMKL